MKTQLSDSIYYKLEVDFSKNRVYFTVLTKWNGLEDFSKFAKIWEEVLNKIEDNFTLICDFRLMPLLTKEMELLLEKIQKYVANNGLCHLAEIVSDNDLANFQLSRISERSNIPLKRFQKYEQAEHYLDRWRKICEGK